MASFYPAIGTWYQELTSGQTFEVIAVDEKHGAIEVQYQDGDIAEFDTESWGRMEIISTAAPEQGGSQFDYGPFDNDDNNLYSGNPLEDIEPDSFVGFDDFS